MTSFLIRRILQMIPTLAGIMLLIFFMFNWVGGDPAFILAGKMTSPEMVASIRRQLGVDLPYWQQMLIFVRQVATFDFGNSWSTGEPVASIFATRLGPSITLMVPYFILDTLISVAVALWLALRHNTLTDRFIMAATTAAMSVSILVYIIIFQYVLAYQFGWFPVQGWSDSLSDNLIRFVPLPLIITLAVSLAPSTRFYRSYMLEEVSQDYVRTARSKGLSNFRTLTVHVLRNTAVPIITSVMASLPALLTGSFLLESFFSIPGIGRELIMAVQRSDFPIIKAITVYVAIAAMILNLLADVLYRLADPRVEMK